MAVPGYYQPARIGMLYSPDTGLAAAAGRAAGLRPAGDDDPRRALLLIDAQVDFIHRDGALSVPGALDDTRRTIEWIYEHAGSISAIAASLDSHYPMQIFYPGWWVDPDGKHPEPYTVITAEAVASGVWHPTREPMWSVEYLSRLESDSKKELMIWPYHTMLGTPGHAIVPALYEAVVYHSAARKQDLKLVMKGLEPGSEFYSMLEPEVPIRRDPNVGFNHDLVDWLNEFDEIYVAGQAKSHCVLETLGSLVRRQDEIPGLLERIYLLEDCTSSVAHPEIDFEAMATAQLAEFALAGLHRTTTAAPLGERVEG